MEAVRHARHAAAAYRTAFEARSTTRPAAGLPTNPTVVDWSLRRRRRGSMRKIAYELTFTDPAVSTEIACRTTRLSTTALSSGTAFTGAYDLIARTTALT